LFVFGVRLGPGVVVVDEEALSSPSSSSSSASEKGDTVEREYVGDSLVRFRLLAALLCRGVKGWPSAETSTEVLVEAVVIGKSV